MPHLRINAQIPGRPPQKRLEGVLASTQHTFQPPPWEDHSDRHRTFPEATGNWQDPKCHGTKENTGEYPGLFSRRDE